MGEKRPQIALCATSDEECKNRTEKALLGAQVSYLMRCEKQLARKSEQIVFYIEPYQRREALKAVKAIEEETDRLEIYD